MSSSERSQPVAGQRAERQTTAGARVPVDCPADVRAISHPLRQRARETLARVVLPHADDWEDMGCIPASGWRALADERVLELPLSGERFLESAVFLEELGRTGYAGIRSAIAVHTFMAAYYVDLLGSGQQRGAYLSALRRGQRIAALALSEQDAGTDLGRIATLAEPAHDGGYRLSGRKVHVANGSRAGFFVCLARSRPRQPGRRSLGGLIMLVVDADRPGVTVTAEPMLGWRAADVCQVELDDVLVPADNLVGVPARTLSYLAAGLAFERLVAGLLAIGGAAHCIEMTSAFARSHHVNDAPLTSNQAVRHALADLMAELDLVREYGYNAAVQHGRARLADPVPAILKLRATELAVSAARACVQYHGAHGYQDGSAPSRIYRDAAAGTIAGGSSELMREHVFEMTEFSLGRRARGIKGDGEGQIAHRLARGTGQGHRRALRARPFTDHPVYGKQ